MTLSSFPPVLLAAVDSALVTFSIYILAVLGLAWLSNRLARSKNFLSEYFLGSRGLGVWAFALTIAATSSSGGSFMGFPAKIYTHGWSLAMWIGSYMVVPLFLMGLLGKRINQVARKTGAITVPDVIRDRFESPAFGAMSILLILFFMSINLVAQFKAGGKILNTLLDDVDAFQWASEGVTKIVTKYNLPVGNEGSGYLICLLAFGIAVVVYTTYGGFRAVVWTDVMQGLVMVAGVVIMLALVLGHPAIGGLESATEKLAKMTPPRWTYTKLSLDEPLDEDFVIAKGTWLEVTTDGKRRILRTAKDANIRAGNKSIDMVHTLELTTPTDEEVAAIEPEILKQSKKLDQITATVFTKARITLKDPAEEDMPIAEDTWLAIGPSPAEATGYVRTARAAIIKQGKTQATIEIGDKTFNEVPVVEANELPAGSHVRAGIFVELTSDYKHGAGRPGVYVTGPGPSQGNDLGFLPLSLAICFFFQWAFGNAGQPASMVRMMAFNNTKTLRLSLFTVAIYYSAIYFPLVIIFCCARIILPGWEIDPDRIMPEMARTLTEAAGYPWLAGLLMAAPFAAVMSTVDSFLLMISSAAVRDVYQRNINPQASEKNIKRMTYAVTVVVGGAAMFGALYPPAYLQDIIVYCGSGLTASFLVPVALALYWPRFNTLGAMAGMTAGFLTHLSMYVGGFLLNGKFEAIPLLGIPMEPILPGLVVSLLAAVTVALLTAPPPERIVRKFFY